MTSIYTSPPYTVSYDVDMGCYAEYNSIVTQNIETYADTNLGPQTLNVGGSSNIDFEAGYNIRMFSSNGALQYYIPTFSNDVRTDQLALQVSLSNELCVLSSDSAMSLQAGDQYNTVEVGNVVFQYDSSCNVQYVTTLNSNGFRFNTSLICDGTVTCLTNQQIGQNLSVGNDINIGRNLHVQGDVFTESLAMFKDIYNVTTSNTIDQVGYAFAINDTNQLELIRYVRFYEASNNTSSNPLTVTQRVGIFGNGNVTTGTNSDSAYSAYDQMNGYTLSSNDSNVSGDGSVNISSVWGTNIEGNIFYNGGLVGINNTIPQHALDVGGMVQAININAIQSMTCPAYYSTSDQRLKHVIGRSDVVDCYNKILSTDVTQFILDSDPTQTTKTGFIAQEIEAIMPDAVYTGCNGPLDDCKFIEPLVLIGYTVGALQHTAALQQTTTVQHLAAMQHMAAQHTASHSDLQNQVTDIKNQLVALAMSLRRSKVV